MHFFSGFFIFWNFIFKNINIKIFLGFGPTTSDRSHLSMLERWLLMKVWWCIFTWALCIRRHVSSKGRDLSSNLGRPLLITCSNAFLLHFHRLLSVAKEPYLQTIETCFHTITLKILMFIFKNRHKPNIFHNQILNLRSHIRPFLRPRPHLHDPRTRQETF